MTDPTSIRSECGLGQQPSPLNLAPKSTRFWLMAHKVAAGFSAPGQDAVPAQIRPDTSGAFLFSVTGNSMSGAGIMAGDKVVVDRSVQAEHGRLVIAVVDGVYMLRRLFRFNGRYELRAENATRPEACVLPDGPCAIWAVVVGVIRNYPGGQPA